jgi:hypothetical protein
MNDEKDPKDDRHAAARVSDRGDEGAAVTAVGAAGLFVR